MAKETRTRSWTFLVYPESAPDNWRDYLDEEHLEWVESPLHEFDVNPTGEVKKTALARADHVRWRQVL